MHDRELTYSVAVHATDLGGPRAVYRQVHETIVEALRDLGVAADLTPDGVPVARPDAKPLLLEPPRPGRSERWGESSSVALRSRSEGPSSSTGRF